MKKLESLSRFKKFEINSNEKKNLKGGQRSYDSSTGAGTHPSMFCASGMMSHTSDVIHYDDKGNETGRGYEGINDCPCVPQAAI